MVIALKNRAHFFYVLFLAALVFSAGCVLPETKFASFTFAVDVSALTPAARDATVSFKLTAVGGQDSSSTTIDAHELDSNGRLYKKFYPVTPEGTLTFTAQGVDALGIPNSIATVAMPIEPG